MGHPQVRRLHPAWLALRRHCEEIGHVLAAGLLLLAGLTASPAAGGTQTSGLFVEFTATRNQEAPPSLATKQMCPDRPGTHTFAPDLRVENRNQVVITNTFVGFEFTMTLTRSGSQQGMLAKAARFRVTRNGTRPIAGGAARINFLLQPGDCVGLTFTPENDLFLLSGEVLTASLFLTREPQPPGGQPIENPANGHYYEWIVSQALPGQGTTWEMARAEAESRSFNGWTGYLVTITDAEEDAFLIENFPIGTHGEIWLGGSDEGQEGDWYWITGEAWSYENWEAGEPNGSGEENCLEYGNRDSTPQWNDLPCNDHNSRQWIVEYGGN